MGDDPQRSERRRATVDRPGRPWRSGGYSTLSSEWFGLYPRAACFSWRRRRGFDTGLPGSGRPVQDDDLARLAYRYHGSTLQLVSVVLDEDRGQYFGGQQSC